MRVLGVLVQNLIFVFLFSTTVQYLEKDWKI